MSQHLWRGISVVVLAVGAAVRVVVIRAVRIVRNRARGEVGAPPRPAWVMVTAATVLLAAAACGGKSGTPARSPISGTSSATPAATVASPSPSLSNDEKHPNLSRFTDPFDRYAYKAAYSDCRFIGVQGIGQAFGGDPDDPPSVARAYAVVTFPQFEQHREAAFHGCLDAFETAT